MDTEVLGRTMCARGIGDLMLVVHATGDPDPTEWRRYCQMAGAARKARGGLRTLVVSEGAAAPNAAQRTLYKDEVGTGNNRVAVLTESKASRAVLTAMSWFNSDMKAFQLDELRPALAFLQVETPDGLFEAINDMREHLGLRRRERRAAE